MKKMSKKNIVIDTTRYMLQHRRTPRGKGPWVFIFRLPTGPHPMYAIDAEGSPLVPYAKARAWALDMAIELRADYRIELKP